ncbi:DUF4974 domain-containing protein [Marinilabiliaceae bacterium JC017]|nr:DUF4974 domain-containing protein [Marinilabiliaceae bacterium JC017]
MEDISQIIKISELIAKECCGDITSSEIEYLNQWIQEDAANRQIYERLKNADRYEEWQTRYASSAEKADWANFKTSLPESKLISIGRKVLQYAAVILIPLTLGIAIYYWGGHKKEQQPVVTVQDEEVSQPKVQLHLADGQVVVVDEIESDSILEEGGTLIKPQDKMLAYQADTDSKKEESLINTIEVPKGADYRVQLADGTVVYLNSMTRLKYPVQFTAATRQVELEGEAFFEVTKNEAMPFVVKTNGVQVQVLGTSFNVKAYKGEEKVTTLVEGKVNVSAGTQNKSILLKPGEQAIIDEEAGDITKWEVDVNLYTSWVKGVYLFRDQRLEDIMVALSRWYDIKVFYMNPAVKEMRFGGHLNREDGIESLLDMLALTNKVEVRVKENSIVFYEK